MFPPWALAAAGAAISAAYLFQRSLGVRALMFLCVLAAAWLSGKKLSFASTIIVSAGIVAANLLVPVGRVLAVLGPFRLTESALLDGIGKALVFEGLVHISKASIMPGLRLPGRFGVLVASAFVYYDRIVEYRGAIRPSTLIEDADRLMLRVWEEPLAAPSPEARRGGPRPVAYATLAAAVLAAYVPLFIKP